MFKNSNRAYQIYPKLKDEEIKIRESRKFYMLNIKGKVKTNRHPRSYGDTYQGIRSKYITDLLVKVYQQVEPIKPQTA